MCFLCGVQTIDMLKGPVGQIRARTETAAGRLYPRHSEHGWVAVNMTCDGISLKSECGHDRMATGRAAQRQNMSGLANKSRANVPWQCCHLLVATERSDNVTADSFPLVLNDNDIEINNNDFSGYDRKKNSSA